MQVQLDRRIITVVHLRVPHLLILQVNVDLILYHIVYQVSIESVVNVLQHILYPNQLDQPKASQRVINILEGAEWKEYDKV